MRFLISKLPRFLRSSAHYLSIGYLSPDKLLFKTFPYFTIPAGLRMLWIFDAWEKELVEIASTARQLKIKMLFVSSRQAAQRLAEMSQGAFESYWLPEAVTVSSHQSKPVAERQIDILQIGRRWDDYHFRIEEFCRTHGLVYVYEKNKGEIIFPTRREYVAGLANSKISICVPSSITHPERSGDISTMTWRYLESMASKCLLVGRLPSEMKELFGYNPLVEIDMDQPGEQLPDLLDNFESYTELIEQNYEVVRRHHQWSNRIAAMEQHLADFGR